MALIWHLEVSYFLTPSKFFRNISIVILMCFPRSREHKCIIWLAVRSPYFNVEIAECNCNFYSNRFISRRRQAQLSTGPHVLHVYWTGVDGFSGFFSCLEYGFQIFIFPAWTRWFYSLNFLLIWLISECESSLYWYWIVSFLAAASD